MTRDQWVVGGFTGEPPTYVVNLEACGSSWKRTAMLPSRSSHPTPEMWEALWDRLHDDVLKDFGVEARDAQAKG